MIASFRRNHVVRPCQVAAWSAFEALRQRESGSSLGALLRLSSPRIPATAVVTAAGHLLVQLRDAAASGNLELDASVACSPADHLVREGLQRLSRYHTPGWLSEENEVVVVRDPSLLYYYRNRLSGFGLCLDRRARAAPRPGTTDTDGFLV